MMSARVRWGVHALLGTPLLFCMFGLFTSCSSDSHVIIRFWAFGRESEVVQKLIPQFEQRNPGIRVQVQPVPWAAGHEKLLTAYAGNSLPDMCQLGNTWIPELQMLGALESLGPWVAGSTAIRETSYFPGIWDTNTIDSVLYGIPWYVDTRVLFYRSDLLARAGYLRAPRSWSEWFDVSAKLKKLSPENYAIFFPTNNEFVPQVIMGLEKGSRLLKDNNTYADFSGKEFRDALRAFHSFFANGWAPVKTTQIVNLYQAFGEGFFAMYISGPWNIGEFSRRLPPELQDKWMTAPMPGPDGNIGVSLAGGSSFAVFKSSKNKAGVWKLIEYLSEPSVQVEFYRLMGDLPARMESWKDPDIASNKYASAFFQQLNHVVASPKIPEWEQIAQKIREYSELVSMDQLSVEDATVELDRAVNLMLEKRRWMVQHAK
jgi:multiple sugar transport system substrate-binding protein